MIAELKETLDILEKINNSGVVEKKLPRDSFKEQHDNLKTFKVELGKYLEFLDAFEKKEFNKEEVEGFLVKTHVKLMSFMNDIDQIDELSEEILKAIPD